MNTPKELCVVAATFSTDPKEPSAVIAESEFAKEFGTRMATSTIQEQEIDVALEAALTAAKAEVDGGKRKAMPGGTLSYMEFTSPPRIERKKHLTSRGGLFPSPSLVWRSHYTDQRSDQSANGINGTFFSFNGFQ